MTFRQFAYNNVLRNKRTYAAYFFSSALSVMIFFLYAMFIFHPGITQGITRELARDAMKVAEYVLFVFSFFFILYSVGAFLKSRKKEFGILMMHGMSQQQLNLLVFLENMIIGCFATLTGIVFGMLFSKLFLIWGANILNMEQLAFHFSWEALLLTIGAFTLLFLVISSFTAFFVRGNNLLDLLQGDAKPKPEPKASILFSLLAAGLLIGGYALSVTTTDKNIGSRFVTVVPMVIAGTYLMFTQLSVFVIHVLKKRKLLFWRGTNILTLSDLAYRMKDNAHMFFLVSIVSTVTFCAVGTFATSGVYKKQVKQNFPFAISYVSKEGNTSEGDHLSAIEHDLEQEQLAYTKTEVAIISQTSQESGQEVVLVSQDAYNKLADSLDHPQASLQGDEAMFIPANTNQLETLIGEKKTITFKESNIAVQTIGRTDSIMFASYSVGTNLLLVSNEAYGQIKQPIMPQKVIMYQVEDWEQTTNVGASILGEMRLYFEKLRKGVAVNPLPFEYASAGYSYEMTEQSNSVMFFTALLIGAVFFIAAGSFLYFRLYTDLERDKQRYQAIGKIGLTEPELKRTVTIQIAILFFFPIVAAIAHSAFAFVALQSLFRLSIAQTALSVLAVFLVLQVVYFLLIRARYLGHLRKSFI